MTDTQQIPPPDPNRSPPAQAVYVTYGDDDRDSIDLIRVVSNLWSCKWIILGITALFAVTGIVYALLATPIYRAEVVLASAQEDRGSSISANLGGLASLAGINLGGQGDSAHALATLRSRAFAESFILDNKLLPVLFAGQWDAEKKGWIIDDPARHPDIRDGVRFFTNSVRSVSVNAETGLISLSVEWTNPELAAEWVEQLVDRINDQLRTRDLDDARRQLQYLESQLQTANLVELRQAIARLIEGQMQTIMLAQAKNEYAFTVIDPARIPDRPTRPRKVLIVVLMTFCGGMLGIFCALIYNAVRSRQSENIG